MTQPYLNLQLDDHFTSEERKYIAETDAHITKVRDNIINVTDALLSRAQHHDASKLQEPEMSGYIKFGKQLSTLVYGSEEYKEAIRTNPAVHAHYKANTHHPEHYPNGIVDMSLLDIIEMVADWKAACERTKNGNFNESLKINRERFKINDELFAQILKMCKELGWV